jgi:hypothetical protein
MAASAHDAALQLCHFSHFHGPWYRSNVVLEGARCVRCGDTTARVCAFHNSATHGSRPTAGTWVAAHIRCFLVHQQIDLDAITQAHHHHQ